MIFVDSPRFSGILVYLYKEAVWVATEVGTTHLGTPGPPSAPRWVVPPSRHPGCFSGPMDVFWSKKIHNNFCCVWTPFGIDFMRCKKVQKIASGTGHYVNRLVPKNDIK